VQLSLIFYEYGHLQITHVLISCTHSVVSVLPGNILLKSFQYSRHIILGVISCFKVRLLKRNFFGFGSMEKSHEAMLVEYGGHSNSGSCFLAENRCPKCNVERIAMIKNSLFFLLFCHFSANTLPLTFRILKADSFGGTDSQWITA
jgi:hypothetical protein